MVKLILILPVVILVIGWLIGRARISRAIVFLAFWLIGCEALGGVSLAHIGDLRWFAVLMSAIVLALIGPLVAVWFSLITSPVAPAPISLVAKAGAKVAGQAHQAYQNLDPHQKEVLNRVARKGFAIMVKHSVSMLHKNGYRATASFVREASQFL